MAAGCRMRNAKFGMRNDNREPRPGNGGSRGVDWSNSEPVKPGGWGRGCTRQAASDLQASPSSASTDYADFSIQHSFARAISADPLHPFQHRGGSCAEGQGRCRGPCERGPWSSDRPGVQTASDFPSIFEAAGTRRVPGHGSARVVSTRADPRQSRCDLNPLHTDDLRLTGDSFSFLPKFLQA